MKRNPKITAITSITFRGRQRSKTPRKSSINWRKSSHVYTLHLHTVCPKCFAWPKDGERVYEVKDK